MQTLDEQLVQVGARFRGRSPRVRHQMHRDVWNDRMVTYISPDRSMVMYTEAVAASGDAQQATMSRFLEWAGRQLGKEETNDVKK